jgi:hypothetical protein
MVRITIPTLLIIAFPFLMSCQDINDRQTYSPKSKTFFYKIGNRNIPVQVMQFGDPNGIVCINLHDNEFTSVKAAMSVLREKGGTLIRIQNMRRRQVSFNLADRKYTIDPNRMFSRQGIQASLESNGITSKDAIHAVESFASNVLSLIPENTTTIVALHNNTENEFSVKSYLPGNEYGTDAKEVYRHPRQDDDNFILTTDSSIYREMAKEYNSILQDNLNVRKDGSLSVYYGELGKKYVNIETEHGRTRDYARMLNRLLTLLLEENN